MEAVRITPKAADSLKNQELPVFRNTETQKYYTYTEYAPSLPVVTLTSAENDITRAIADANDAYGTYPVRKDRKMFPR